MNTAFLILAVAVAGVSLVSLLAIQFRLAWPVIAFAVIYFAIALLPLRLLGGSPLQHVGMAPLQPELRTYGLAAVGIALIATLLGKVKVRSICPLIPLLMWLAIGMALVWSGSPEQVSGVIQYVFAACAWISGCAIGMTLVDPKTGRRVATGIAYCIIFVILVEVLITLLQVAGFSVNALDASDASLLGSRANGTTNHPNTLGKLLVLSICLLLPISQNVDRRTERFSTAAVLLAFIPLALAQGRANFIAAVLTIVLWIVIRGLQSGRLQIGMLLAVVGLGSVFAGVFVARFAEDPEGGARTELLDLALSNIEAQPLSGVGPNSYTKTFGPLTGSWIPVHNSFLLVIAEIGLIGFVAFMVPLVLSIVTAWRSRKRCAIGGACAASLLASVPGVVLIAMTGWAMVANIIFPLWFFTLGLLYTAVSNSRGSRQEDTTHHPADTTPAVKSGKARIA